MAKYGVHQAESGLWTVVEEGSTNPVAGGLASFQTGMAEEEARQLAAKMNAEAEAGTDERN